MTYGRARLWTGITGVGSVVVLAVSLLLTKAPAQLFAGAGGALPSDFAALFAALGAVALLMLPFDIVGGLILPRRYGRPAPTLSRFFLGWLRGVLMLSAIAALSGATLLLAGREGGVLLSLLTFTILASLSLASQELIARLVGGLRRVKPEGVDGLAPDAEFIFLRGADPAFTGGFTGAGTMVLPERWVSILGPETLALFLERRQKIVSSGAWKKTVAMALAWNITGFWLATLLPGAGVSGVDELVATSLSFSLWTFLGLLLLPTLSRRGVHSADAMVSRDDESRQRLLEGLSKIDQLQDDEPSRAPGLEVIFHPVPALSTRLSAEAGHGGPSSGFWHLARTALFLSHVGLSLLPRAVHCNSGRPELWVYLPGDG